MCHKPAMSRTPGPHQNPGRDGVDPPKEPPGGTNSANTSTLNFWPPDWGTISFCCPEPLGPQATAVAPFPSWSGPPPRHFECEKPE